MGIESYGARHLDGLSARAFAPVQKSYQTGRARQVERLDSSLLRATAHQGTQAESMIGRVPRLCVCAKVHDHGRMMVPPRA